MIYLHLCLNLVPTLANKYIPHSNGRDSGGGPWVPSPGTHLSSKERLRSCEQQVWLCIQSSGPDLKTTGHRSNRKKLRKYNPVSLSAKHLPEDKIQTMEVQLEWRAQPGAAGADLVVGVEAV